MWGAIHPEGVVRRSRSDAENSTSAPTARMPKVSSFGCVQARPPRAPDSLLLTSAQPGLEPPNPLARVWRLQPWLGLAQQGRLRTDLAAGRGVRRLPRQQEAILQCRHCQPCCQPLAVYCQVPAFLRPRDYQPRQAAVVSLVCQLAESRDRRYRTRTRRRSENKLEISSKQRSMEVSRC